MDEVDDSIGSNHRHHHHHFTTTTTTTTLYPWCDVPRAVPNVQTRFDLLPKMTPFPLSLDVPLADAGFRRYMVVVFDPSKMRSIHEQKRCKRDPRDDSRIDVR